MKKGFTLIELLAVIVILAIIALIATPIILGIINDAREKSNERSVELYVSAVRNAIATYQLTGTSAPKSFSDLKVQYDGDVKCEVQKLYSDGSFYIADCTVNGVLVDYSYGTEQFKTYENGDVVFYDVDNGVGCEGLYTESQSKTGVKTGCMKFYAFNDDGSDKINLILDHNTTSSVEWTNSTTTLNTNGPINVLSQLKSDTNAWVGTIEPANYEYKNSERTYLANYSGYKARLITGNEVAQIVGVKYLYDENGLINPYFYFHDLSENHQTGNGSVCASTGCKYGWLYDRTSSICTDSGCLNNSDTSIIGYWLIDADVEDEDYALVIDECGSVSASIIYRNNGFGVRPVITIYKSQIK